MLKHFVQSSGTNFIILFISMFQGILVARVLHAEGKGIIAVYMSIYGIVYALSNLGIGQSSSFLLSKEKLKVQEIASVQIVAICVVTLFTSISLFIIFYIQDILNYEILIYFLLMIPLALYVTYTTSFALSYRWIEKINGIKIIIASILFISLVFFYLLLGLKEIEYYFVSQLIAYLFAAIYVYSWTHRIEGYTYKFDNYKLLLGNSKKIVFKGITYALPLFIYGLNYKVDIWILNSLVDPIDIGVYSVGVTFAEMIWQLPAILSIIIFSYSVSNKDTKEFSTRLWENNKKIMLLLLPVLVVYALIIKIFIPILFGEEFLYSYMIAFLLLPGTYAVVAFNILNADLAARGFPSVALSIFSIAAIVNIALNYLLIPIYGIDGAAIASSLSYIFASCVYVIRYYQLTFTKLSCSD